MSSSKSEELSQAIADILKAGGEKNEKSKSRKKEMRGVEVLLKSMNNLTTEEKLKVLTQKYAELLEENRSTAASLKNNEKHMTVLQKEKEQLQMENGKSLLARSRLEELCRELQRQNKVVKEESMLRVREEEERRKEVSTKFQTTLSEVSALLQQNNDKNQKLRDENSEMATKLQMLCDQYSLREQHLEKLGKQYDIERQLNEAKLAKIRMDSAEAKEKLLKEKQILLLDLTEYQKKCQVMQEEEVGLRHQLSMYTDKYDDFQKALKASNQQFSCFKTQMDEMTKKLKSLEKETALWKQRWEKSNSLLTEMASEKKQRDSELLTTTKQLAQLEKLCRAMQTERASLITEIKSIKMAPFGELSESTTNEGFHSESVATVTQQILTLPNVEQPCSNSGADVCHIDANKVSVNLKEIDSDANILLSIPHDINCEQFVQVLEISAERCTDLSLGSDDVKSSALVHSPSSETANIIAPMDSPSQESVVIN
ncbi:alpha-taxilin-like [Daphnia pulex]|uniref:alpha-taxilin-like n=1 Tax=Daphnia pulex TaxID=6669 RepID=UPI001EE02C99|nr:alpha-taxilin-like [Daphnia pulex]